MNKETKLLVTGCKGLVGSEITGDVLVGKEFDLRIPHQSDEMVNAKYNLGLSSNPHVF
jgi:hypothetical protein